MPKTKPKRICVSLTVETLKMLDALCKERGEHRSPVLRMLIREERERGAR